MNKLILAVLPSLLSAMTCVHSHSPNTAPNIYYLDWACTQPIKTAQQRKQLPADINEAIDKYFPTGMDNLTNYERSKVNPHISVGTPGKQPPFFVMGYYDSKHAAIYFQNSHDYGAPRSLIIIDRKDHERPGSAPRIWGISSYGQAETQFRGLFCTVDPAQPIARFDLRVFHHQAQDVHYRDRSEPIAGVVIRFIDESGEPAFKCITDNEGSCRIKDAPVGSFSLWPSADGFSPMNWNQKFSLIAGDNPPVDVFMIEGTD